MVNVSFRKGKEVPPRRWLLFRFVDTKTDDDGSEQKYGDYKYEYMPMALFFCFCYFHFQSPLQSVWIVDDYYSNFFLILVYPFFVILSMLF